MCMYVCAWQMVAHISSIALAAKGLKTLQNANQTNLKIFNFFFTGYSLFHLGSSLGATIQVSS